MHSIDVVIPTGKEIVESNKSILFTLRSIVSQTVQPNSITVVENGYNLGVEKVVRESFGKKVTVIQGLAKCPNIAYSRNLGASKGNGDIILFLDDDVVLGYTNYFSRIQEIMSQCDFCCGAKRYWSPTNWQEYISLDYPIKHNLLILKDISFIPQSIERSTGRRNCSEYSYIGNFGAINRDVFERIEKFDEEYEGWLYQDTDLMMRLVHKGYEYEVLAYSDMFCYHLSHPADKEEYRTVNYNRFLNKQRSLGIVFDNRCFFGRFEGNNYSVISNHSSSNN